MEAKTPFSQEDLNEIFKISLSAPDRVISRESSSLEFKESFGWASLAKYLKTSAAYANAKGGYIVFGIANKPHRLCGLSGTHLKLFEDIDPEKMSSNFNEHFAPEIEWTIQEYELQGKVFGLLYIHEAKDKPVVCTKDAGKELKESDIYYRYRGRSERIKYPELRAILEAKRESEQRLWMKHLVNIARIGVREAGIFDLHTGSVTGSGGSFLIDESLLSQLSFIKEGEFSEVKGQPTLKLIGNVEPLTGGVIGTAKRQIVKIKGIRTADIVLSTLNQDNVPEPEEYIKQICFESAAFLPVYYFIKKSGMTPEKTVEMLEGVVSRSATRGKLIERLKSGNTQELAIPNGSTAAAIKKRKCAEALRSKKVNAGLTGKELEYCLQAIRGLTADEVKSNSKYIRELLRNWFNKHYALAKGPLADNLRRAICWVDEALNMGDCK
ncbi:ATP-binding protein [Prosthecochloris vibrioformis]|uniref:ATP-binding protein n=1 Tax=Prosthecochloris vibrioformis TaxID=1098 RepID=A0A5C4S108_PROVB|nr:ATP-binding protein [Prosthecochloris vibrioformis]TNJ36747.1 ATP-binding protein [Prosthecochloris vibrioformis]